MSNLSTPMESFAPKAMETFAPNAMERFALKAMERFALKAMVIFSNGRFQKVDSEMLKKRMERFPHSPWLENEDLRGRYQSLDSSAFLDLESGVLPGQNPSLDLKSGKEHQWVDYQYKDFEDRFHQRYRGTNLMVESYNRRVSNLQISNSKNFEGALQGWSSGPLKEEKGDGSECQFSKKMFEEELGGLYQISNSKNFEGALQGGSSGPPKEEKGDGGECRDAEGERSRSGTSQDLDGGGVGSLSGESQGPDREGTALGENQGGDGNSEGNGSGDGGDEHQGGLDVENGGQENNQEEIDIPRNEINMAIIGATTVAAVDFHYNGFISTTILGLLTAINVFAFLCCMTSMLHSHRNRRAARIFGTIGAAAGSFGFLLLVSVPFSSYYPWIILILGSLAILVIFVLAFKS